MRPLALSLFAALPALAPLPAHAHEFTLGDLEVGHPFSLETPAASAAGYLAVINRGTEADALLAVRSAFPAATLHTSETDAKGVVRMVEVERFDVAPGDTLTLSPGGAHIMFEGVEDPLEAGESFPATLVFERSGELEVEFHVEPLSFVSAGARAVDHDAMAHGEAAPDALVVGDLTLSAPFSRATLPNAPVAAGFLSISNGGTEDDRLLSASSAVAGETQIHEMAVVDEVMRMRPLPEGLPIPAGATVELAPGGFHLMFMDLQEPLVEGETVEVTLTFERAGRVVVPLAVGAPDAEAAGHGAGHGEEG